MIFTETPLEGAYLIDLDPINDDRGFFARAWSAEELADRGLNPTIAQTNMSRTFAAGTFRGFHWQEPPFGECKTVRCTSGAVFNAIIDMRPNSDTFRSWFGVELSSDNGRCLYIPEQFANGFLILEPDTTLLYNVSRPFRAGGERGIRWDDPLIGVEWPIRVEHVSEKDSNWPDQG
ncbi:MAG: dTDP-4-dehydrorhamnose 3,5-epimerase family protein [Acidimicrobiales bacterium]